MDYMTTCLIQEMLKRKEVPQIENVTMVLRQIKCGGTEYCECTTKSEVWGTKKLNYGGWFNRRSTYNCEIWRYFENNLLNVFYQPILGFCHSVPNLCPEGLGSTPKGFGSGLLVQSCYNIHQVG